MKKILLKIACFLIDETHVTPYWLANSAKHIADDKNDNRLGMTKFNQSHELCLRLHIYILISHSNQHEIIIIWIKHNITFNFRKNEHRQTYQFIILYAVPHAPHTYKYTHI